MCFGAWRTAGVRVHVACVSHDVIIRRGHVSRFANGEIEAGSGRVVAHGHCRRSQLLSGSSSWPG